jgi:hypothetical protein
MAYESVYFKRKLKQEIKYVQKQIQQKISLISDARYETLVHSLDIKIFIIACICRKLIDDHKVSSKYKEIKISCLKYENLDGISRPKWIYDFRHFDIENLLMENIPFRELLNRLIHNAFLESRINRNRISSFFVSSDFSARDSIYEIGLKKFLMTAVSLSENYPHAMKAEKSKDKWKISCE